MLVGLLAESDVPNVKSKINIASVWELAAPSCFIAPIAAHSTV